MKKNINEITLELNLQYNNTQDWGIINSSPNRVIEFIDYFLNHQESDQYVRNELLDLVLSSYNELLQDHDKSNIVDEAFRNFILSVMNNESYEYSLIYWSSDDEIEFPAGVLLKKIVASNVIQ